MKKPKAILFDWDNTLVDSFPAIHRAWNAVLTAMGHPTWTYEEARANVGPPGEVIFPQMFGDRWKEAVSVYYDFFEKGEGRLAPALPGAKELLDVVCQMGVLTTVVSAKRGPHLRDEISHLGWGPYFKAVIGAGDAVRDKPHPESLILSLEGSGILPGPEIWYLGDSKTDIELAENTGCIPFLVHANELKPEVLARVPAGNIFQNCEAFTAFLTRNFL